MKEDRTGRPYVETEVAGDTDDVLHVAHTVLHSLGIDDDVGVLALGESKALYDEFAVDDTGEDVYLSDGAWLTTDGRWVSR